jgi:hypothetical protein
MSEQPRRHTLSDQLAMQHELLMAALARSAPRGSESCSVKDVTIGDLKGKTVIENLTLVRGEDEDWPAFLGRCAASLDNLDRMVIAHNVNRLQRELDATLEKTGPQGVVKGGEDG